MFYHPFSSHLKQHKQRQLLLDPGVEHKLVRHPLLEARSIETLKILNLSNDMDRCKDTEVPSIHNMVGSVASIAGINSPSNKLLEKFNSRRN